MVKLESYTNLSKQHEQLLKKNLGLDQLLALSVYGRTPQGISIKSTFKHSPENTLSSTFFNYKNGGLNYRQQFQTSKQYTGTVEYVPYFYKQLKAKAQVDLNSAAGTQKKLVSLEYTNDQSRTKVTVTDDIALKLASVFAVVPTGGGAFDVAFDVNTSRFSGYNASLWWFAKDYRMLLRHISTDKKSYSFGNLVGYASYNYNPKTKLFGTVVYDRKKDPQAQVGFEYDAGNTRIFKARVTQDLLVSLSMRSNIGKMCTLVTGSHFNLLESSAPSVQFGVELKVNR